MDLLGDLGAEDQLTSARAENAVLQKRVKELTEKVKKLYVENESLKAEVELYRQDATSKTTSTITSSYSAPALLNAADEEEEEVSSSLQNVFLRSGNGVYPKNNSVITLSHLHGPSNPLCCALSADDTLLATGGADATVRLVRWGPAWCDDSEKKETSAAASVVKSAVVISCNAPVIAVGFATATTLRNSNVLLAAGCMDGSLQLIYPCAAATDDDGDSSSFVKHDIPAQWNHRKYVRAVAWARDQPLLATASADGDVHVYRVEKNILQETWNVTQVTSLHLPGAVEALCFCRQDTHLVCYARDTPYLSYFDIHNDWEPSQINLNKTAGAITGGFDEHVSFCIMDLQVSPCGTYLAAATDASRNIILEAATGRIIRNLYGHQNDGFSQPKVAWSRNGQYLLGNTQEEAAICVWDIASSKLVERLTGHGQPIRDMCAGNATDCLTTTSFDKQTKLWFAPAE